MKKYLKDIEFKASQYIKSETAKSMVYDPEGLNLAAKVEHLIAIICYTDFTALSSDFTRTFRKISPYESREQVQKRNGKYWYWSKYLRDAVWKYGLWYERGLRGPFYTGMSWKMNMPQFTIYLVSPTSTSVHIEVALKFASRSGIIIEFDNPENTSSGAKCIDCSWISRYKEEDERYGRYFTLYVYVNGI